MKNSNGIFVGHGLTETSPVDSPNKTRLPYKLALVATSALLYWAALGLAQPAKAEGPLRVADINSAVRGLPQATNSETPTQSQPQYANDAAISALSAFAQQIAVEAPASGKTVDISGLQFDDQAISALQDFAQRLGTAQPESIKGLPKLAADNWLDSLRENAKPGSSPAPEAASPSGPVAGGKHSSPQVAATYMGAKTCATCHGAKRETG